MTGKKKNCLLIDDNYEFSTMLSTALKVDFEINTAQDAFTAHQLLSNKKFDIILCDVQMPFMDGIELAGQLKKKLLQIPIIFLTGDANPNVIKQAFEVGAANILQKPFDLSELHQKIETAINLNQESETRNITDHELGYIYNLLKSHYYDIQEIMYQIQYYKVPLSVIKDELDKKERMGCCHLDDPHNIKFLTNVA